MTAAPILGKIGWKSISRIFESSVSCSASQLTTKCGKISARVTLFGIYNTDLELLSLHHEEFTIVSIRLLIFEFSSHYRS